MNFTTKGVIILSLLLVSYDFSERFLNTKTVRDNTQNNINNVSELPLPQLSKKVIKQLDDAYNKYQLEPKEEIAKEATLGMTAEQQLQQNGDLIEFYYGDWRYRLLAVIFPEGKEQALTAPLALLRSTNIKDSKAKVKVERIYHGSLLSGYNVAITDTKQVNLQRGQQKITLLMYQSKTE